MMLSVNLKDSVLTTQSVYVDLKSKKQNIYLMSNYEYLYEKKNVCVMYSQSVAVQ